ncbi:predicted protein [Sclerotinia sclerotiorum 1980 UF-70]|uniref:Uncharacterized protein n=1 Tax=Sclerotinia sclerotiorum (strain ATCC 18683 / 1980 / Ss-1) TaxID=665079 RepID=A7EXP7_SCLS1|nr:predicted protein [Sclerotinia sclerotiorum 1980 UF-70]EDN94239.1 predicted protein [Sclerotinia sclerotiorum 1980 UF-70]
MSRCSSEMDPDVPDVGQEAMPLRLLSLGKLKHPLLRYLLNV